jgi:mRNA-degrading endonuclease toxin of MazEF toxin-antitoxin module
MKIFRGQVYYAFLDPVFGRETGGFKMRPVVVIWTNDLNDKPWSVVTVVPGTSNTKYVGPNLLLVKKDKTNGLEVDTVFQCHQIRALDKGRLTRGPVGSLSQNDLNSLNKAIRFSIGL